MRDASLQATAKSVSKVRMSSHILYRCYQGCLRDQKKNLSALPAEFASKGCICFVRN